MGFFDIFKRPKLDSSNPYNGQMQEVQKDQPSSSFFDRLIPAKYKIFGLATVTAGIAGGIYVAAHSGKHEEVVIDGDIEDETYILRLLDGEEEKKDEKRTIAVYDAAADRLASGDLAAFELVGNVQSCSWKLRYKTDYFTFNQQKRWTNYNAFGFNTLTRNEQGLLIDAEGETDYSYISQSWSYDDEGALSYVTYNGGDEYGSSTMDYYMGDNGFISSYIMNEEIFIDYDAPPKKKSSRTEYTYPKGSIDKHHNWTRRIGKDSKGGSWVEKRVIIYY